MEQVVLVNKYDKELGIMDKLKAHQEGVLHRSISIFLFNSKKEMLIQKRSLYKYHSALLWSNACCSHPKPKENYYDAAQRRLYEELGIKIKLDLQFYFIYKADVGNNLIEYELDYIFLGLYNNDVDFNKKEVAAIKWIKYKYLKNKIEIYPNQFTEWFKIILNKYHDFFLKKLKDSPFFDES